MGTKWSEVISNHAMVAIDDVRLQEEAANDPAAFLRHAEEVCLRDGIQLTPLRRRVLEELAKAERPLGAYDIVERLGRSRESLRPHRRPGAPRRGL